MRFEILLGGIRVPEVGGQGSKNRKGRKKPLGLSSSQPLASHPSPQLLEPDTGGSLQRVGKRTIEKARLHIRWLSSILLSPQQEPYDADREVAGCVPAIHNANAYPPV